MCSLVALPIMTPADSSPVALRRRSTVPQAVLPLPPLPDRLNPVLLGTPHPSVQDPILHDPPRCWLADSVQWPRAQAPPSQLPFELCDLGGPVLLCLSFPICKVGISRALASLSIPGLAGVVYRGRAAWPPAQQEHRAARYHSSVWVGTPRRLSAPSLGVGGVPSAPVHLVSPEGGRTSAHLWKRLWQHPPGFLSVNLLLVLKVFALRLLKRVHP